MFDECIAILVLISATLLDCFILDKCNLLFIFLLLVPPGVYFAIYQFIIASFILLVDNFPAGVEILNCLQFWVNLKELLLADLRWLLFDLVLLLAGVRKAVGGRTSTRLFH